MKIHKTVKKLLKQGYNKIEISEENIYVTIEYTMTGEDFYRFFNDYSGHYYLNYEGVSGAIAIVLTKKN